MSLEEIDDAAREASRERSRAMFINGTYDMCRYFGVPVTAFHKTLEEGYGRSFLKFSEWTSR